VFLHLRVPDLGVSSPKLTTSGIPLGGQPVKHRQRPIKRKRQYDENPEDTNIATISPEELFRVEYFVPLVDQAIASLTTRFEQYKDYKKNLVSYLLRKHCNHWMTMA
jgi:hypothetical protein